MYFGRDNLAAEFSGLFFEFVRNLTAMTERQQYAAESPELKSRPSRLPVRPATGRSLV
jgi:hypothetical protein